MEEAEQTMELTVGAILEGKVKSITKQRNMSKQQNFLSKQHVEPGIMKWNLLLA